MVPASLELGALNTAIGSLNSFVIDRIGTLENPEANDAASFPAAFNRGSVATLATFAPTPAPT